MRQRFESHAPRKRSVSDNRNDLSVFVLNASRDEETERRRNRRRRVTDAEKIVLAFAPPRKTRNAARKAERRKRSIAPGQQFVRVALMTHVPYDRVFGTRKHTVQRNRKFDDAEIACEMTAVFTDDFDNRFSDFTGKKRKFGCRKFFNICRGTYAGKDRKKPPYYKQKRPQRLHEHTRPVHKV